MRELMRKLLLASYGYRASAPGSGTALAFILYNL
jgi:hypothetical protein